VTWMMEGLAQSVLSKAVGRKRVKTRLQLRVKSEVVTLLERDEKLQS